jgi:hypothetical protein
MKGWRRAICGVIINVLKEDCLSGQYNLKKFFIRLFATLADI